MPLASISNCTPTRGTPLGAASKSRVNRPRLQLSAGALALALQNVDEHVALLIDGGGEHLAGLDGNGGVARDEDVHQAAESFEAEGKRRNVKQKDIFEPAGENFRLDGRAQRDGFVGVLRGVQARAGRLGGRSGRGGGRRGLRQIPRSRKSPRRSAAPSGMRVWPPTRMTWSRSLGSSLASASERRQCGRVRSTMSRVRSSSSARVSA